MPFDGERSQYKSIRRITESETVRGMLAQCTVREYYVDKGMTLDAAPVQASSFLPRFAIAIDGGMQQLPARNGFPGAEFAYLTVSTVILDVLKLKELDDHRPINPVEFRKLESAESLDVALPGCNVVYKQENSTRTSFRRGLFECLQNQKGWEGCETLLDTYEALLRYRELPSRRCPLDDCEDPDDKTYRGFGIYKCQCGAADLYSTDSLRIFEGVNPQGSSGEAFSEVLQVLERLRLIHLLRMIEQKGMLAVMPQIAFVLDGPLAVYGHPAWLSQAISKELRRINDLLRVRGLSDLLIVGIEKTGLFAAHLALLDQHESGELDRLPRQSVYLPTDDYIKNNIVFQRSQKIYGSQTYFGRKFFYKTRSGSLIVGSVPYLSEEHAFLETASPAQFPRLQDALALLDQLETTRYPNALIPLTAAHAEAALPMNIGRKVLEQLARELMGSAYGKQK